MTGTFLCWDHPIRMNEKKPRPPAIQAAIEAWAEHIRRERDRRALIDDVMQQLRASAAARAEREADRMLVAMKRPIAGR